VLHKRSETSCVYQLWRQTTANTGIVTPYLHTRLLFVQLCQGRVEIRPYIKMFMKCVCVRIFVRHTRTFIAWYANYAIRRTKPWHTENWFQHSPSHNYNWSLHAQGAAPSVTQYMYTCSHRLTTAYCDKRRFCQVTIFGKQVTAIVPASIGLTTCMHALCCHMSHATVLCMCISYRMACVSRTALRGSIYCWTCFCASSYAEKFYTTLIGKNTSPTAPLCASRLAVTSACVYVAN
jgi:hypothetical protein